MRFILVSEPSGYYPKSEIKSNVAMQPTATYAHHTYSGFEPSQAFDVVFGGHFEHRLLSSKRATLDHRRLMLGDVRLDTGCYDFPVIAQGAMPSDSLCIGMVVDGLDATRYNTEYVSDEEIQLYAPGAELMYHAEGPSRWITVTLPQAVLENVSRDRIGAPLTFPTRGIAAFKLPRRQRAFLRQLADDAFAVAAALHPAGMGTELASHMSQALVRAYVDGLCAAEMTQRSATAAAARRHFHLILACERLVLTSSMPDADLSELARRSGYTLRSLELIFRRGVGMTPNRWFTNVRLNGALRDLVAPAANLSVTDVAMRWGFRHLSRFSEQYRNAFGELPSHTLDRARARI